MMADPDPIVPLTPERSPDIDFGPLMSFEEWRREVEDFGVEDEYDDPDSDDQALQHESFVMMEAQNQICDAQAIPDEPDAERIDPWIRDEAGRVLAQIVVEQQRKLLAVSALAGTFDFFRAEAMLDLLEEAGLDTAPGRQVIAALVGIRQMLLEDGDWPHPDQQETHLAVDAYCHQRAVDLENAIYLLAGNTELGYGSFTLLSLRRTACVLRGQSFDPSLTRRDYHYHCPPYLNHQHLVEEIRKIR